MTTEQDGARGGSTFIPQGYPLWAEECSDKPTRSNRVHLVVGWRIDHDDDLDEDVLVPVVVPCRTAGDPQATELACTCDVSFTPYDQRD